MVTLLTHGGLGHTVQSTHAAPGDHGGHGAGAEEAYGAAACGEAGENVGDLAEGL